MHRYGTIWVSAANHLCRLLCVEMALTKGRSPASNWHQSDIDVRDSVEGDLRTCVPGIPAPVGAFNEIPERGSAISAPRVSSAVVVGSQDAYPQAAKRHDVARLDLSELQTTGSDGSEQAARACWGDENRGGWDESQGGQVSVVSM
jgi:hypothetical protein